jgi:cullin 1
MTNYLNQKYIFMTSAYQTAILLQFNNEDTLSLEELITATELPKEEILPVLNLLCKGKVLLDGGDHQYDLNPSMLRPVSSRWMNIDFSRRLQV